MASLREAKAKTPREFLNIPYEYLLSSKKKELIAKQHPKGGFYLRPVWPLSHVWGLIAP
jgi:hypothetical protein